MGHKAISPIRALIVVLALGLLAVQSACRAAAAPPPHTTALIFRNWEGDISPGILAAFEAEYGIKVRYLPYETQEQAVDDIRAGQVYDLVVLENQLIPPLVAGADLTLLKPVGLAQLRELARRFLAKEQPHACH